VDQKVPARIGAPMGVLLVIVAVLIAYASLKLYDEPVRRRLAARFLRRPAIAPSR
jgi:peptidoglycan/LPS O-acetylase OafA/YrhL